MASPIKLMMNAGLEFDMPQLVQSGADGIGLFRTELQFMISETMPRLADQTEFYKKILDAAPATSRWCSAPSIWAATRCCPMPAGSGRRTLALGWRAIRIALDRPALLRYQVRCDADRHSVGRTLRILLPMVSDVDEFNRGRAR